MKRGPRFHTAPQGATLIDTGHLFMIAVQAANTITAPEREGGEDPALVSIAFSVITLEAFLNEAVEWTQNFIGGTYDLPIVSQFAQVMSVLEKRRDSLEDKFSIAHSMFVGKPADFGSAPYQDLKLLVALRNELLHFKPNAPVSYEAGAHPVRQNLRERLRAKNILAENVEYAESWLFHASTKAVARWACKTAANVAIDFVKIAPESGWRTMLQDVSTLFEGYL